MNITHIPFSPRLVKSLLILSIFLASLNSIGQFNCASHQFFQQQMIADPQFKRNQQLLEEETRNYLNNIGSHRAAAATYIIPVVFHIIHTGGSGNISDAQIIDQMEILNKEFKRQ